MSEGLRVGVTENQGHVQRESPCGREEGRGPWNAMRALTFGFAFKERTGFQTDGWAAREQALPFTRLGSASTLPQF